MNVIEEVDAEIDKLRMRHAQPIAIYLDIDRYYSFIDKIHQGSLHRDGEGNVLYNGLPLYRVASAKKHLFVAWCCSYCDGS